ncbi:hypothetical protein ABIA24_004484 [Sinorhizobium fredii]
MLTKRISGVVSVSQGWDAELAEVHEVWSMWPLDIPVSVGPVRYATGRLAHVDAIYPA